MIQKSKDLMRHDISAHNTMNIPPYTLVILCLALAGCISYAVAQTAPDYDALVQKGKTQLQAGSADLAVASGEAAIKMNADRWEGYALAGGALMNLKRYEQAADKFSNAIEKAPEPKQAALRDLRRQCLVAESGAHAVSNQTSVAAQPQPSNATQAEIVLWKTIENSQKPGDFEVYLSQYPNGAFAVLAHQHLDKEEQKNKLDFSVYGDLPSSVWMGPGTSSSTNLTIVVIFLDSGRLLWEGFELNKGDKARLDNIKSGLASHSKDDFINTYRSQLRNAGTFGVSNGSQLRSNLATSSSAGMHCNLTLEGELNHAVMNGESRFIGDSTKEGRKCESWPRFQWHLQRQFQ
jgi:tetratricopeptide (TPR) repeat protein